MIASININGTLKNTSSPLIMGILNVTPDSFFDGGKNNSIEEIEKKIEQFIYEGASIIDIGAISTRPGAKNIDENTEWSRLLPSLNILHKYHSKIIFSIDTFRSTVAHKAVRDYGVALVNDISAGNIDNKMHETIAQLNVPYIIMHMQGNPQTMQVKPIYKDLLPEIIYFFSEKINNLNKIGINDIIIDPGFGFGKEISHNFAMLLKLDAFNIFNLPILVGLSRKSMIYKTLKNAPQEALNGTSVLNAISLIKNANILRVHDVKEALETVNLIKQMKNDNE